MSAATRPHSARDEPTIGLPSVARSNDRGNYRAARQSVQWAMPGNDDDDDAPSGPIQRDLAHSAITVRNAAGPGARYTSYDAHTAATTAHVRGTGTESLALVDGCNVRLQGVLIQ